MKINISRQNIYLAGIFLFLLLFVLLFSFLVLIPQGKDYREKRIQSKTADAKLQKYRDFFDETEVTLKELQKKHRHIIVALDTKFNAQRFKKQYKDYFSSLEISEIKKINSKDSFVTYAVNTTSQISSPKTFYNFLDAVNKADWIIGVNFPINFKRDGELIKSSFTMQIFTAEQDSNKTKESASTKEEKL